MKGSTGKLLFALEGNIGAGKSTLLKILEETLAVDVVFEPCWEKVGGQENLLDLFYKDMNRWAYTFQSYAFIRRVNAQQKVEAARTGNTSCIIDRSPYCDRFCFAKNAYKSGLMTDLEWEIYTDWFEWLVEKYTTKPSGFIYLKTDPKTCHRRIAKRERKEEAQIPLSYLQAIHDRHNDWLIDRNGVSETLKKIPLLVLEADQDFENNAAVKMKFVEQIKFFIDQTGVKTQVPCGVAQYAQRAA